MWLFGVCCPSVTNKFRYTFNSQKSTTFGVNYKSPMKMKQCSETSAHKFQTPGHYPRRIQYTEDNFSRTFCSRYKHDRVVSSLLNPTDVIQTANCKVEWDTHFVCKISRSEMTENFKKFGAGKAWSRSVKSTTWEMKKYYMEWRRSGIYCIQ
jgi:hypothetical protein